MVHLRRVKTSSTGGFELELYTGREKIKVKFMMTSIIIYMLIQVNSMHAVADAGFLKGGQER